MVEEVNQSIVGNKKSIKNQNDVNTLHSYLSYPQQSKSDKLQNYFQFRSAEYQQLNKHFNKPYPFSTKQTNQSYKRDRTNMNNEQNIQEYCRYRNAAYRPPIKMSIGHNNHFLFPCYSQLKNQNENEYSKYRDSRSSPKNSTNGSDNICMKLHTNCRSLTYDDHTQRFPVPDDRVSWKIIFPDYTPIEYTTEKIQHNRKADPCDPLKIDKFNQLDENIDRRSFTGHYYVDPITNRPQNPIGRTGITGRGRLYYWGPNHAGDPVVTRWLRDANGSIVHRQINAHDRLKPVLEFVAIQRRDTKQWALPGGMVDAGEHVCETIKREFQEEAIRDGVDKNYINQLFSNGYKLYESYIDDPRNTDNAWIETVAVHFHDETGELTKHLHLNAGDDAQQVVWCPIDRKLKLYASHKDIIKTVVNRLDAFW